MQMVGAVILLAQYVYYVKSRLTEAVCICAYASSVSWLLSDYQMTSTMYVMCPRSNL